jgi:hypothetical protein
MNVDDKLRLIRALEERETAVLRRGSRIAWLSVIVAALVLASMIAVARRNLASVSERTAAARADLEKTQQELAAKQAELERVTAQVTTYTGQALRDLQSVDGRAAGTAAVESAVDNLLAARTAAAGQPAELNAGNAERRRAIEQLFDPNAAVRVRAYSALLPRYANDPTLVPEILDVARRDPRNANGIYNALVVLSHMNAATLRPYEAEITRFAESTQGIGPRVAERSRTLLQRLPR